MYLYQSNQLPTANQVPRVVPSTMDKRLTWAHHTKFIRKQANIRLHLLRSILKSKIRLANEILVYETIIRPYPTTLHDVSDETGQEI